MYFNLKTLLAVAAAALAVLPSMGSTPIETNIDIGEIKSILSINPVYWYSTYQLIMHKLKLSENAISPPLLNVSIPILIIIQIK